MNISSINLDVIIFQSNVSLSLSVVSVCVDVFVLNATSREGAPVGPILRPFQQVTHLAVSPLLNVWHPPFLLFILSMSSFHTSWKTILTVMLLLECVPRNYHP